MLRMLLTLQHQMAGLDRMPKAEISAYYMKLIALLASECAAWLQEM